jgi:hypothetical protein
VSVRLSTVEEFSGVLAVWQKISKNISTKIHPKLISCNKYEKEKKEELPIARQIHQVPLLIDEEMVDELCFTCKMISCKRHCIMGEPGGERGGAQAEG